MAQKLAGKVAVVTGAGGGIGAAICVDMAAEGVKVVVNDFSKADADRVVKDIQKAKGTAVANYDTVATMAGGENIIKTAVKNFGRIDILVNTAGFSRAGLMIEMSEETWDSVITVHLKGHFACSKPAAIQMIKQKSGGRIINFSSAAGFRFGPAPFFGIGYATAKAGVVGFTAKLSGELKEHGITVNAMFPSALTKGFPEERPNAGPPDMVAPMVLYLCTDEAKDITGHLFSASEGNVGIYPRPVQGQAVMTMKMGKWTLDELSKVVPTMVKRIVV
jgi:NAD(P)-dependent dehydrogenase (short-subunit alcohol dehydrogenase family)